MRKALKLVRIGEAARMIGVTEKTLRNWEARGWFSPSMRSRGGDRLYSMTDIEGELFRMGLAAENKKRGKPAMAAWPDFDPAGAGKTPVETGDVVLEGEASRIRTVPVEDEPVTEWEP